MTFLSWRKQAMLNISWMVSAYLTAGLISSEGCFEGDFFGDVLGGEEGVALYSRMHSGSIGKSCWQAVLQSQCRKWLVSRLYWGQAHSRVLLILEGGHRLQSAKSTTPAGKGMEEGDRERRFESATRLYTLGCGLHSESC